MELKSIRGRIAAAGLAYRGAFHPDEEDAPATTLILVGFIGSENWPAFESSQEAADGQPNPLDRWSLRVVSALAADLGATALFPFGEPFLPFQRWAQKAEPVHASPLSILIHPDWGLWHAYRGALAFAEHIALPPPDLRPSPCDSCADKPCLSACPVGAFTSAGYDVPTCIDHIGSPAGADCMGTGCQARLACPVGPQFRYRPAHGGFHLNAFLEAQRPVTPPA
jgi:hypothetical protein